MIYIEITWRNDFCYTN